MVEAAFDGADGVFHLAAMWLLHCQQLPSAAFEVNIRGTFNVMDACVKKGVKRLVFSSSRSAYGGAAAELVHEEDPLLASDFYGASKTAGEALLHAYHHRYGLDYAALRYMNVYGPRQAWRGPYISVIMKMLTAIEAGQGPTIIGEGSERFDFVAVEDCALANLCAMGSDATDRAYNVGTGQATTLRDLAELLLELTGSDLPINFVKSDAVTTSRGTVASTERAAAEIGFEATIPLRKGLARLIDWRAQEMRRAGL
jgi:UDP-glucose 4-epimerase